MLFTEEFIYFIYNTLYTIYIFIINAVCTEQDSVNKQTISC